MKTIYRIATSLCDMNNWEIDRLDIQRWKLGDIQRWKLGDFEGYVGYLYVNDNVIRIREDGSFEYKK